MGTDVFSGNGAYTLDVDASLVSQNKAAGTSTIYWRIIVRKRGTTGHVAWGINGSGGWADSSRSGFPDLWKRTNDLEYNFQNGSMNGDFTIADGTFTVTHASNGTASYYVNGHLDLVNLGSAEAGTGTRTLPKFTYATVPDAPTSLRIDNVTQTTLNYHFQGNDNNGAAILEWQVEWYAAGGSKKYNSSDGNFAVHGAAPATTYSFRARGRNSVGWGPYSALMSARTKAGARLKIGTQWREAVPWIKVNGVWKVAQPQIKTNGAWKKSA